MKADYVIIGGDFNLPDKTVKQKVLPQAEAEIVEQQTRPNSKPEFRVLSCPPQKIDFFIVEGSLSVDNPRIKEFESDVKDEYGLAESEDRTEYLDHKIVVANVEFKAGKNEGIKSKRLRIKCVQSSSCESVQVSSSESEQASSSESEQASSSESDQERSSKSDHESSSESDQASHSKSAQASSFQIRPSK